MTFFTLLEQFLIFSGTFPFDEEFRHTQIGLTLAVVHLASAILSSIWLFTHRLLTYSTIRLGFWFYFELIFNDLGTIASGILIILLFAKRPVLYRLLFAIRQVVCNYSINSSFQIHLTFFILALFGELVVLMYASITFFGTLMIVVSNLHYVSIHLFCLSTIYQIVLLVKYPGITRTGLLQSRYSNRDIVTKMEIALSITEDVMELYQYYILFVLCWFVSLVVYLSYILISMQFIEEHVTSVYSWMICAVLYPVSIVRVFSSVKYKARTSLIGCFLCLM